MTALVVILNPVDFRDEGADGLSPIIVVESKLTTKAALNYRTPRATP
jgi:hypothetical protein